MNPKFKFLNFDSSLSFNFKTSIPSINKDESFFKVGLSKVPKSCNKVVFPAPEAPTIETISPDLMLDLHLLVLVNHHNIYVIE